MAEKAPLVPDKISRAKTISGTLKRRYVMHTYPRGACIVLLYFGLAFSLYGSYIIDYNPFSQSLSRFSPSTYDWMLSLPFILLSYPVCGVIGEQFARYKVIIVGVVFMYLAQLIMVLLTMFVTLPFNENFVYMPASLLFYLGNALFLTNYVQFGLDQLLSEPSNKLQSYIYWLVGMVHLLSVFISSLVPAICMATKLVAYNILIDTINGIPFVLLLLSFCLICCCKRHINIEPPPQVNPVKHIYKVMKYAWSNKYPVRRSAFTYAEMPSRLDLCKERYGGPFTTDEVEDVKSFWRILAVLLSMFGLLSYDTGALSVADQYYHTSNLSTYSYANMSFTKVVLVYYPQAITYGSLFLCVLAMQLLFIPFLSKYLPRLLFRMGMGLLVGFCANVFSIWVDGKYFPYGVLMIPEVLYGCVYFLSFVTGLEFIVAQAPLRMQGLLIGLFTQFAGCSIVLSATLKILTAKYWLCYIIKSALAFLSCLIFLIAALKYRYRERNEAADVNERLIIAEYYERQISRDYYNNELIINLD